ncbi:replication-relaxation family protein [Streptomyces sp. NPDC091377]|uniref:replication-relaxation family protein n=1 Tax=Streptomyces sp. NPDC091377 TaxID=3365995 RepID=UPI003812C937
MPAWQFVQDDVDVAPFDAEHVLDDIGETRRKKSTPAAEVCADALRMLGRVRIATVRQMAQVITEEDADGRSYVRGAMNKLAERGPAETNGKDGKHQIWNLTRRDRRLWPTATSRLPARRPAQERRPFAPGSVRTASR